MFKILQARLQQYINQELSDVQSGNKRNQRSNWQHLLDHRKSKGIPKKKSTSASLTMLKFFYCVDHNKLWGILKEMVIPYHLNCLLRNLYAGPEATVRTGHRTRDWLKTGKGVCQGYCLPAYLTYTQSTLCEMLGWMTHKLESRLPGEISTMWEMQMIPL